MEMPPKIISRNTIQFSSSTSGYLPEENKYQSKKISAPLCLLHYLTLAKTWKQPKCPLMNKWIKMCYIYINEYYSAIPNNELLPFTNGYRGYSPSEIGQTKTNTVWFHLYVGSEKQSKPNKNRLINIHNKRVCWGKMKVKVTKR